MDWVQKNHTILRCERTGLIAFRNRAHCKQFARRLSRFRQKHVARRCRYCRLFHAVPHRPCVAAEAVA